MDAALESAVVRTTAGTIAAAKTSAAMHIPQKILEQYPADLEKTSWHIFMTGL